MNSNTPRTDAALVIDGTEYNMVPREGLPDMVAHSRQLERELNSALADTARLNWLQAQFGQKFRNSIFIADHLIDDGVMMDRRGEPALYGATVREVIDAAMKPKEEAV